MCLLEARQATRELIDTLWNVNAPSRCVIQLPHLELIDTLWNVNEEPEEPDEEQKKKN